MSTAEYWIEFEREWLKRLKKSGLPYFHRKELGDLKKYTGLLTDLASIIRDHAMRKFGMVVRVAELHKRVSKAEYDGWHLDAYSWAGRGCAAQVRIWTIQQHLRTLPRMVFAKGDTGRDQLEKRLRADGFDGLFTFAPAKDEEDKKTKLVTPAAVPLQAADLLAYEIFAPIRKMEVRGIKQGGLGRNQLSDAWFILDKIPGDPRVTEDASLDTFTERIRNFNGKDRDLVKGATWMPDVGGLLSPQIG